MPKKSVSQNVFEVLGLENLPEERKVQLMVKMGALVQRDVMLSVFDRLSEPEKDEFAKIVEQNPDDPAKVYAFIEGKVPDIDEVVKASIESMRGELLALAS